MEFIKALEGWGVPVSILMVITGLLVLALIVEAFGKIFGKNFKILKWLGKPFKKMIDKKKAKKALLNDMYETLKDVQTKLPKIEQEQTDIKSFVEEIKKHYSEDNINKRDKWMLDVNTNMKWVHDRARVYDASVKQLIALKEIVEEDTIHIKEQTKQIKEQTSQIKQHTDQIKEHTGQIKEATVELKLNNQMTSQLYKDSNRKRILDFAHDIINNSRKKETIYYTEEEVKKVRDTYDDYEAFLERYGGSNGEVDDAMEVIRDMQKGAFSNIRIIKNVRNINE